MKPESMFMLPEDISKAQEEEIIKLYNIIFDLNIALEKSEEHNERLMIDNAFLSGKIGR